MDNQKDDFTKCVSTMFEKLWKGNWINSKMQKFVDWERWCYLWTSLRTVCGKCLHGHAGSSIFPMPFNFTIFHRKYRTDRCQNPERIQWARHVIVLFIYVFVYWRCRYIVKYL